MSNITPTPPDEHSDDDSPGPLWQWIARDDDEVSRQTRAAAHEAAKPKRKRYRDAIELAVAGSSVRGMTAFEIHVALSIPYSSVQSPVLELIELGRLRRTGETRLTPYGKNAAVIVSALLPEGCTNG